MQEQNIRLTIPTEETYNQIYKDYGSALKQAKIMITDYFDTPDLRMLKDGIVFRQRTEDGRNIVQTKKKLQVTDDNLFISESKEELQNDIKAAKMHNFLLQQYEVTEFKKVLTLRTLRQMYYCKEFDFILDKTQYQDYINNKNGVLYEVEMEVLSLNKGDIKFLQRMGEYYNLKKSKYTKMEKVLWQHLDLSKH